MLTAHELFGFMSPALAGEIIDFTHESEKPTYKATLAAVAQSRHLRPVFLERQPRQHRNETMIAALARPSLDAAASTLIRTWLVKKYPAMLEDFLNALAIPNEKGVVDNLPAAMEDEKLKTAVDGLLDRSPG